MLAGYTLNGLSAATDNAAIPLTDAMAYPLLTRQRLTVGCLW